MDDEGLVAYGEEPELYAGTGLNAKGWWRGEVRRVGTVYGDAPVWMCRHNHKDVGAARRCGENGLRHAPRSSTSQRGA